MYSFEGIDGVMLHLDAEGGQLRVTVSDPDNPVAATERFVGYPTDGGMDLPEALIEVLAEAYRQNAEIVNARIAALKALVADTTGRDDLVNRLRGLVASGAVTVDTGRVEFGRALVDAAQVAPDEGGFDPNNF